MTEDELVAVLAERLAAIPADRILVGIGDDAAVWQPSRSARSLITTDALVEGVHFTRDAMRAEDVGHRALAANLSDVAAMGGRPVLATVALGFPPGTDPDWLVACYEGMAALATRARCPIVGGDLTRAPAILLSITVIGEVRPSNCKTRDAARPGDVVAVTGPLGASRAGLAATVERPELAADDAFAEAVRTFRTPEPRLAEGRWLGASRHVHAMMDCSDGLSTDLGRICRASGTGAIVESIPVHPAARRVAERTGADPERYALDGGEDFELLVTVGTRAFAHLAGRFRARFGRDLLRVGTITEGASVRLANGAEIAPSGWDHVR